MNTLSNVLKTSAHDIYENIVRVVVVNVLWFIVVSPALFLLSWPVAIVYLFFTLIPGFVGVIYAMKSIVNRERFKYSLFFVGVYRYYGRALILSLVTGVFLAILFSSWWYYLRVRTNLTFLIAIVQTYFFLMVSLAQVYTIPILVTSEKKLWRSMAISLRLFLENGFYTFLAFLQIVTVNTLLLVTVVSFPLLFAGMASIFLLHVYYNVMLKYTAKQSD